MVVDSDNSNYFDCSDWSEKLLLHNADIRKKCKAYSKPVFGDGGASLNASTIQTSIFLINSYKEIIKSSAIMNKVVEEYPDLGLNAWQLSAKISVTSANNSQVMNLIYEDTSYARVAEIVNAVSTVFKEQIPHIMNVDNITILSEADMTASLYQLM